MYKCLMIGLLLISNLGFAAAKKEPATVVTPVTATPSATPIKVLSQNSNKKSFVQINIGMERYKDELPMIDVTTDPSLFFGLNGGEIYKLSEKAGAKWYMGFDYANKGIYTGDFNNANIILGFDGVMYFQNQKTAFNLGPVVALSNYSATTLTSTAFSLGANLSLSFFIKDEFGLDVGLRYFIPTGDINIGNASQMYLGFNTYF